MKTLVIFRDCHARHNLVWPNCTPEDEQWIRKYAQKRGWKVCVRKKDENNDYVLSRYLREKLVEKELEVKRLEADNKSLRRYSKLWADLGGELLDERDMLLKKTEGGAL